MTTAQAERESLRDHASALPEGVRIDRPEMADGSELWRLAKDSQALDVNSPYSYLLWCRDFTDTSVVARDASGRPVGFVTGYLRPEEPGALFVWQVAVDDSLRGHGVASALLDALSARVEEAYGLSRIETTITPDNRASDQLFRSYARRHGADLTREVLFPASAFPATADDAGHEPEVLYRIDRPAA
ncbi:MULTISPECIES: diaminobutyrate acetyltransferase [unclassified Streptomyces]|uniref:diaminobutyrate acetyltransferase n=1 Tax=unclassified Streptomyces TaxID=2593676 RepID=UPI0033B1D087